MPKTLRVTVRPGNKQQGFLHAGGRTFACALGRSGLVSVKREGDGGTPVGRFRLLRAMVRADQTAVQTALPRTFIGPDDGWCDAVGDRNYNRPVALPYPTSHEVLMRRDRLYDVVIVLDHNITSRMSRGGSAIFFHIAKPGYPPTEGCVAISPRDMAWVAARVDSRTIMQIG